MREERSGIGTGILLVAVGLLFLADRQGLLSFARLWPVLLIVMGVVMLAFPNEERVADGIARRGAERRRRSRSSGGLWMVFVGVLLLANQNHWMTLRDSWPLFIVAGGLALIFGSISRQPRRISAVAGAFVTTGARAQGAFAHLRTGSPFFIPLTPN